MIYLDHAAATPLSSHAFKAMQPYFSTDFFNPSAAYLPAKQVAAKYNEAKNTIAHAIGAKGVDLVITGSATEANNLAFTCLSDDGETLVLATEHASVLNLAGPRNSRNPNLAKPSKNPANNPYLISVLPSGRINLDDLKQKITDKTELISVALANNELGTIQPLAEISHLIREIRQTRLAQGSKRPIFLHSDASQALNLLDVSVARLGVDLLTLNAAKIYGPKGVGALYVSHAVQLSPLTRGGGQENGLRSGTENVPGVIGFAAAIKHAKNHLAPNRKKFRELKQLLLDHLEDYELINHHGHTLDNFIVLCYDGLDAERLLFRLEDYEVYVATGAACAANKGERSHVLAAIGLSESQIAGSLRLSLGDTNDETQILKAAKIINEVVRSEKSRLTKNHNPSTTSAKSRPHNTDNPSVTPERTNDV